ncbi:NAD-dependent epimerase/dehydratase family protein [Bermanella sp. WJH001]|uniref:NAD-dependent epimerase/dehydratase family protein n=1 Tax=Bermanella sp. WJH001 TaxID=3048005 RepID=UPI0024BD7570|nr:NAD-dependent epimerase/dehydratase family protein [Bermanella sp. WJH001]MDJ1536891.1 NAD-dependent epimerase/dehydratase family protein [Bermanella sp. WJH001]
MKILITGAAGDIGSRLVEYFQKDHSIDLYTSALNSLGPDVSSVHKSCDIRDNEFIQWIKEIKPHVIIHLASIIQLPDSMSREEAFEIDVVATENLVKAAIEVGVQKFVVASSGAAYGYWHDNPQWLSEEMPVRGNEDYFYSSHKRQVEEMLARYRSSHPQLKQVVLRPGTVLGPNFNNPITNMFRKKIITGIAGSQSPFVIIWVDDLVAYLIEAAKSDVQGVFNVAGDGTLTLKEIARFLNKPYLSFPSWLLRAALWLLKPLGLSQYGPEQVKFIEFRPVLTNKKIKQDFLHQPEKTTKQAFISFIEQSDEGYVQQ